MTIDRNPVGPGVPVLDADKISIKDSAGNFDATDVEAALAELAADAHDASAISVKSAGGIAADDVQEALEELDSEKTSAADLAATSDTAKGDALIGVKRSDDVEDTLHNILESYTFLRGNQTAVAGSKMKIDLLREDSTVMLLEHEASVWPDDAYTYAGFNKEFTAGAVSNPGVNGPLTTLFVFAQNNGSGGTVDALIADAVAWQTNDAVFAANFIARSAAGADAKLVGLEIDWMPAAGTSPLSTGTALVINSFNVSCPIGIHMNAMGAGYNVCFLFGSECAPIGGGDAFIGADAQTNAYAWGINLSNVTNFTDGAIFLANGIGAGLFFKDAAGVKAVAAYMNSSDQLVIGEGADSVKINGANTHSGIIGDDAVSSFTPVDSEGMLLVNVKTTDGSIAGMFSYSTTGPAMASISSAGLTAATGALTGTTGVDGNFTISAHSDGKIYFENRTGATFSFEAFVITS